MALVCVGDIQTFKFVEKGQKGDRIVLLLLLMCRANIVDYLSVLKAKFRFLGTNDDPFPP